MPLVLVSGFDAWGDIASNPSWNAVEASSPELPDSWEVRKLRLPVSWEQAHQTLLDEWTDDVAAVIAFGVAPRNAIEVEQIAINLVDPEASDVDGVTAESENVIEGGPAAYLSTLPAKEILEAMKLADIPAARSPHAGTYLCNQLFYHILHEAIMRAPDTPAGFIHVPNPAQSAEFTPDRLQRAVELAIETTCQVADSAQLGIFG